MDFSGMTVGNTTPLRLPYQIGEAMANAGVPVVVGGGNSDGINLASTVTAVDCLGITIDAQATLVTAQQSDNSDPARRVSVIVDASAFYKAPISGGAAEETALTLFDVTTASTDGLSVTTGDAWNSPNYDEGVLFGFDGNNAGIGRKITSADGSSATVIIALPFDTVVGDNFIRVPYCASPMGSEDQFVQLSTLLTELDASVAVDVDNNNFRVLALRLHDRGQDPDRVRNYALIKPFDLVHGGGANV